MADSNPDLLSRIREIMTHFGFNQSAMAKATGIQQPNLSAIMNGKRTCDEAIINKICLSLDIQKNWLLYGEGEMLRSEEGNATMVGKAAAAIEEATVPVRFFEVTPTATFQEFCAGVSEIPDTIHIIPNHNERLDESYCVFEVCGDSMAPQIQNRARVLCQEIAPTRWHNLSDCVIVIAYADRFVIKRVATNRLSTENYLILSSDNPDYPTREKVWLADIRAIFRAVRIVTSPIF